MRFNCSRTLRRCTASPASNSAWNTPQDVAEEVKPIASPIEPPVKFGQISHEWTERDLAEFLHQSGRAPGRTTLRIHTAAMQDMVGQDIGDDPAVPAASEDKARVLQFAKDTPKLRYVSL